MKRLLLYILLAAAPIAAKAQPRAEGRAGEFKEFQVVLIARQLMLDPTQDIAFKKIYTEYSTKLNELQPKGRKGGPPEKREGANPEMNPPMKSAEQIEKQILESFDLAEKSTALKREYYYKFKEVLKPQQILKMYNIERRLHERIVNESDRRGSMKGNQ